MEIIGHAGDGGDGNGLRAKVGVDCTCEAEGVPVADQIAVGDLAGSMDAGVSTTSTLHNMIAGLQFAKSGLDGGLHGGLAAGLALPAVERATVIVDFQGIAWHSMALAYECVSCNAKALALARATRHVGPNDGGVMRRLILALCLMAGSVMAQEESVLPPDGGLDDVLNGAVNGVSEPTPAINADFVATISTALQEAKGQAAAVDLAMGRLKVPETLQVAMREHLGALMAENAVQGDIAMDLALAFDSMGMTPSNPDVIARLAGEQLLIWGDDWLFAGLSRMSAADQAEGLAWHLRIAQAASAQECADYLTDVQDVMQTRHMQMRIMATWPVAEATAGLALLRRTILAEIAATDDPPDLTFPEISQAEGAAGLAIMAAIDATEDPARLYAAFGYPEQATPDDICKARLTMLQAVQGMTGPDAAVALRYVASYGLNG